MFVDFQTIFKDCNIFNSVYLLRIVCCSITRKISYKVYCLDLWKKCFRDASMPPDGDTNEKRMNKSGEN